MLHESLLKDSVLLKDEGQSRSFTTTGKVSHEQVSVVQDGVPCTSIDTGKRRATETNCSIPATTIAKLMAVEIRNYQNDDPDIGPIIQAKVSGLKTRSPACRHY